MSSRESPSTNVLDGLETYIPADAELRSVPVSSLPSSTLRKMNLCPPPSAGTQTPAQTPRVVLISPAVVRRKRAAGAEQGDASSQLAKQLKSARNPCQMSFVSSSVAAYLVLKDMVPGRVSDQSQDTRLVPQGSVPLKRQDSILIYQGHVYLAISKGKQRKKRESPPPGLHSTSAASPDGQRKCHAPEEAADERPLRRRLCGSDPRSSLEMLPNPGTRPSADPLHSQQLTGDLDRAGGVCRRAAGGERAAAAAAHDGFGCDASGGRWWSSSSRRPPDEAAVSSTQLADADAKELRRMEEIAQLRARLQQTDAALNSLTCPTSSSSSSR